jgi:hypothetical protein
MNDEMHQHDCVMMAEVKTYSRSVAWFRLHEIYFTAVGSVHEKPRTEDALSQDCTILQQN